MNVQFSFCGLEKAFGYEIVLRGTEQCFFFSAKRKVSCFEIQPRQNKI